jgi:hypothetical protein
VEEWSPSSPPIPVAGADFFAAIPAVVFSGAAGWMAALYWWNVLFGRDG